VTHLHLHTATKAMSLTAVLRWLPLVTLLAMNLIKPKEAQA